MPLKKIVRLSPSEQVFNQMRKMIQAGEWSPGERLPSEIELAAQFGVSRISVRQAILRLSTMGLLETRWGEGNFVQEMDAGLYANALLPVLYLSENSIHSVWEFRMIVEVEGTFLAAQRITDEQLRLLSKALEKMADGSGDVGCYVDADFGFLYVIMMATDNPILLQTQNIMRNVLIDNITMVTKAVVEDNGLSYHGRILEALRLRDAEAARTLMREHLQSAYQLYADFLSQAKPGAAGSP